MAASEMYIKESHDDCCIGLTVVLLDKMTYKWYCVMFVEID